MVIDMKTQGFLKKPSEVLEKLLLSLENLLRVNENSKIQFSMKVSFLPLEVFKEEILGGHEEEHPISKLVALIYLKIRVHHEATVLT